MALGVPTPGSAAVVLVGATSTPTAPVGGLSTWTYTLDNPTATHDYYGQPSVKSVGKSTRTINFNNDYETADSGHAVIYAAAISKATIWIMLKPDGTNGETLPVKVSHQEVAGGNVNDHTTVTWTFEQQTDPAQVGTGFGT